MSYTDNQAMTVKYFSGYWVAKYKDGEIDKEMRIYADKDHLYITHVINGEAGEQAKHSGSWHWFGENHLCFLGAARGHYIRSANEKHLLLGELERPDLIGPRKWELQFDRVEHF